MHSNFSSRRGLAAAAIAAVLGLPGLAWAGTQTFSNPALIEIPESGEATPYPSTIDVTGLVGPIEKITVTLFNISHTFISDVGAVLVGPDGQATFLFDGAGGFDTIVDLTWTFDDDAAEELPAEGPLTSGTFRPGTQFPGDDFPGVPGAPYPASLAIFNGISPNGTWSLYVLDFVEGDSGQIAGGWSLDVTTASVVVPEPSTLALSVLGVAGAAAIGLRRRVRAMA